MGSQPRMHKPQKVRFENVVGTLQVMSLANFLQKNSAADYQHVHTQPPL